MNGEVAKSKTEETLFYEISGSTAFHPSDPRVPFNHLAQKALSIINKAIVKLTKLDLKCLKPGNSPLAALNLKISQSESFRSQRGLTAKVDLKDQKGLEAFLGIYQLLRTASLG